MRRKDCARQLDATIRPTRRSKVAFAGTGVVMTLCLGFGWLSPRAQADSVRLWPSAVVVGDTMRLSDLCRIESTGDAGDVSLADLVIGDAPRPGGSRLIHMAMIRAALASSGVNMARVTLGGATRCAVVRPRGDAVGQPTRDETAAPLTTRRTRNHPRRARTNAASLGSTRRGSAGSRVRTLRDAVVDYFTAELRRYGGTAGVVFDRTDVKLLDLPDTQYDFRVRRNKGPALGLISLNVDVRADGRTVQTVPMVVQVTMIRRVVIAARPINQGSTVRAVDVDVIASSFTRLTKLGFSDPVQVIGQRAKRFISAGTTIDPNTLESVPLVARGQVVTLTVVSGAVRIVTTATATKEGRLGEIITVRSANRRRTEFDAVVIGPSAVRIGGGSATRSLALAALGGTP